MPVIISCINLKGGVGKTTIAVNLAAYCGSQGKKVLLIDLDPQTNASFSVLGVEAWQKHAEDNGTIANLFGVRQSSAEGAEKTASDVLCKDVFPNVDLLPSHLSLFSIDLDLAGATAREKKLGRALAAIRDNYDIIICDCPPNLTLPTQNALAISTHFTVPVSLDFLSALGIGLLLSRVKSLGEDLENTPENAGIIISRVGRPAQHREDTEGHLRHEFGSLVLTQTIKDRAAVSQAAQDRQSIFDTNNNDAKNDFRNVFYELLEKDIGV